MRYKTSVILFVLAFFVLPGCMVIWTNHVFMASLFKSVDANKLGIVADPNSTQLGSSIVKTKNDRIKVVTPFGIGETGGSK